MIRPPTPVVESPLALSFILTASRVEPSAILMALKFWYTDSQPVGIGNLSARDWTFAMTGSNTCANKSGGKQASRLDKACLLTLNGSTHSNPSDSNTRITSLNREILRYTKLKTTAIITGNVNSRSLPGPRPSRSFCDPGLSVTA